MIACIDLKSFYASVECALLGLDPLKVNLVVADIKRGNGSIVLAVTPALKRYGVSSRCRIYELPKGLDIIYAKPRMKKYIEYSTKIYSVYLKYFSSEDIHIYSIDEAFLDLGPYMKYYNLSAEELVKKVINDVYETTKINATCGIGENMFLAKVALDVLAKHEKGGIATLNKEQFKEKIWNYQPITDIVGIGNRTAKRLEKLGITTVGQIAKCPLERLEKEFGIIGRELLERSYGIDRTTVQEARAYIPESKSIGKGQVLFEDYNYEDLSLVLLETVDELVCELVTNKLTCKLIGLSIVYSKEVGGGFSRQRTLPNKTNSRKVLVDEFMKLYNEHVENLPIRRVDVRLGKLSPEDYFQNDLFNGVGNYQKEHSLYEAIGKIKNKFGKGAVYLAVSNTEKGTLVKRNKLIGGHNAE